MSLLLAAGHLEAHSYPIGMVWAEASFVVTRQNSQMATEAILIQMAVSSVLSKKAGVEFKKMTSKMTES